MRNKKNETEKTVMEKIEIVKDNADSVIKESHIEEKDFLKDDGQCVSNKEAIENMKRDSVMDEIDRFMEAPQKETDELADIMKEAGKQIEEKAENIKEDVNEKIEQTSDSIEDMIDEAEDRMHRWKEEKEQDACEDACEGACDDAEDECECDEQCHCGSEDILDDPKVAKAIGITVGAAVAGTLAAAAFVAFKKHKK